MTGIVELNRFVMWSDTVELDDGLRMRLSFDEWKKLQLQRGQWIPVRLPYRADVWVQITDVIELQPNVLVTLSW